MNKHSKWFYFRNTIYILILLAGIALILFPFYLEYQCHNSCTNDQSETITMGGGAAFFLGVYLIFSDVFAVTMSIIFSRYKTLRSRYKFGLTMLYLPFIYVAFAILFWVLGDGYAD